MNLISKALAAFIISGILLQGCGSFLPSKSPNDYKLSLQQVYDPSLKVALYLPEHTKAKANDNTFSEGDVLGDNTPVKSSVIEQRIKEVINDNFTDWAKFSVESQQQLIIKVRGIALQGKKEPLYSSSFRVELLKGDGSPLSLSKDTQVLEHDELNDQAALGALIKSTFINSLIKAGTTAITELDVNQLDLASIDLSKMQNNDKQAVKRIGSGTGFYINNGGEIVTNNHVIDKCLAIQIVDYTGKKYQAKKLVVDEENDLALIRSNPSKYYTFINNKKVSLGESVFTLGFPAQQFMSSNATLTSGVISALSGIQNAPNMLQISAPIQPGNSGGPLISMTGKLLGVVSATINSEKFFKALGTLPQNVNFAINHQTLESFLINNNIRYRYLKSNKKYPLNKLADFAQRYTVRVECSG